MLALQKIAQSETTVAVKEIADDYGISFDLLAKVLNQLSKAGILVAYQGIQGGYTLAKKPSDITVADILSILEGSLKITDCADLSHTDCSCAIDSKCSIKTPMQLIQERMKNVFESMTLADMVGNNHTSQLHTIQLHN